MKLNKVEFQSEIRDGEQTDIPTSVTVTMTIQEAVYLACLLGKQSGTSAEEALPQAGLAGADTLNCNLWIPLLKVIHGHWDEVDEAIKDLFS